MTEEITETGEVAPAETPSLRDSLLATFDEMEGTKTESAAPTPEEVPASAEGVAPTAADESEEPATAIPAPVHWSREDQTLFDGLDENVKKVLLGIDKNLQSGFTQKTESLAQQRKRYEGFDQFFSTQAALYPNVKREDFERGVINLAPQLVQTYMKLQQDPVGTLRQLADAYNVNDKLSEALLGQDNDEGARSKRQRERDLEEENLRLKSAQQETAARRAEEQITQFKATANADGTPKYPYFSELEPTMAKLLQTDPQLGLDGAYQRALRLEKHEELLKAEVEKATKALEEERRTKVNILRKPNKPTAGKSNGAGTPVSQPKSLREQLSEEWDQLANQ